MHGVLLGGLALGLLALLGRPRAAPAAAPPSPAPPPADWPPLTPAERALLAKLHPDMQSFTRRVLEAARREGLAPRLISGRRTCAEQNALYAQGRTSPGPVVTHARGCQSWHVQGRAVDFEIPGGKAADYARVGQIAKDLGGKWGGDFKGFFDQWHLEYHPGLTIEQACPDPDNCKDH